MLTQGEQAFLNSLSDKSLNRKVRVKPFNPAVKKLAEDWMVKIKRTVPDLEVVLTGSLAYEVAGEEDVDISIWCPLEDQEKYRPLLDKVLGKHKEILSNHTAWEFYKDGIHVGVWLVDRSRSRTMIRGNLLLDAFNKNPNLIKEYENLKLSMNGKTYKEYQTAKYEFYHKVIGEE